MDAVVIIDGRVDTVYRNTPLEAVDTADGISLAVEPDTVVAGFLWDGASFSPPAAPAPTADEIDTERDRRVEDGFTFNGIHYQSRRPDRENIAGASVAALAAMTTGAQAGDLRWHGGDSDFVWIAADNSLVPMDAQTMFAFGQAAMAHKQAMIFAARALKDANPIPADFADDGWWT